MHAGRDLAVIAEIRPDARAQRATVVRVLGQLRGQRPFDAIKSETRCEARIGCASNPSCEGLALPGRLRSARRPLAGGHRLHETSIDGAH
jgi:hypothetical protein